MPTTAVAPPAAPASPASSLASPAAPPQVHPTAHIGPDVTLAPGVKIGPHCVLTGRIILGEGVTLLGSNYIFAEHAPVEIGANTRLWPHACVGFEPQDYKFNGVTAGVKIGSGCMLREGATVHSSTKPDRPTIVGNNVFMMVNTHVAHDCIVGDRVVMVNGSALAGHCEVGDDVTLGGNAVIHQFCRIGRMVMMSGDCGINKDVPPFFVVSERNRIGMLNLVGLRRKGFPRDQISVLNDAFKKFLYRPMPRDLVLAGLRECSERSALVCEVADFLSKSSRGFVTGFGKPTRGSVRAGRAADEPSDPDPS